MATPAPISVPHYSPVPNFSDFYRPFSLTPPIYGSAAKSAARKRTPLRLSTPSEKSSRFKLKASREVSSVTQEFGTKKLERVAKAETGRDLFNNMKNRFLSFKKNKYLEDSEHFQNLAQAQSPKFMVIACADSRVCPSNILGFQPGEAFTIRNVANLVPPFESGPSETNAALEFAVNSLQVENILVIGHSCCGGIQALMSMQDESDSSFISKWVVIGKIAKLRTEAAASNLTFDQKCRYCEKESVNRSLLNLLTYPWIEEKARKGVLAVHGGYYDFINCTFEKWTLDYNRSNLREGHAPVVKDRSFWR